MRHKMRKGFILGVDSTVISYCCYCMVEDYVMSKKATI